MNATETSGRDLIWRVMDDEAYVLDTRSGDYFSLNPVGTEVWKMLQEGCPIPAIVTRLAVRYGITTESAATDVNELLGELRSARLWEGE